jgi:hypothetical protein
MWGLRFYEGKKLNRVLAKINFSVIWLWLNEEIHGHEDYFGWYFTIYSS